MFTLDQARGFVAVAEELHFGNAAVRLSMAQPSLSKAVQRLEQQLGVELLHRSTRKVELTLAGTTLLDGARRTIAEAEQGINIALADVAVDLDQLDIPGGDTVTVPIHIGTGELTLAVPMTSR